MKIAVNASFLSPNPSGIGIYTLEILKIWANLPEFKAHQVDIFSPWDIPNLPPNFKIIPLSAQMGRSWRSVGPAMYRHWWNAMVFPRLAARYDRVYAPSPNTGNILQQIITIHDLISLEFPQQHRWQYVFTRWRLPRLLQSAQKVICISQATQQQVWRHFKIPAAQTAVVHNGTKPPGPPTKQNLELPQQFILCVGLTLPHKNLEVVLRALPHTDLDLIITGQTNERYAQKLRELCAELQISPRVHWWGYCPDSTLDALYRQALALVYPSRNEGFGLPLLEAQQRNCPVIISATPALMEVGGAGVKICAAGDPLSWAQALQELQNPQKRQELVALGAVNIKRFSWEKCAREIAKLILAPN